MKNLIFCAIAVLSLSVTAAFGQSQSQSKPKTATTHVKWGFTPYYVNLMEYAKYPPKNGIGTNGARYVVSENGFGTNGASGVNGWGWSKTGKVAFSFDHGGGGFAGGFTSVFFIIDLVTDKTVYNLRINSEELGIDEEVANAMKEEQIYALKMDDITKAMDANGILTDTRVFIDEFPYMSGHMRNNPPEYNCFIERIKKDGDGIITGYDVVVSKDGKKKKINTVTDAHAAEVFICGFFLSPYERRILVVTGWNFQFEGNNFDFQFSGCDMDKGFK